MNKIYQMTTVHKHNDIRIFEKECKTLRDSGFEVTLLCANTEEKEKDGIKIDSIKSKGRVQRMLLLQFKVIKCAFANRADVYHFHDPELIISGAVLKLFGKKVIYDVHEDLPLQVFRKPYISNSLKKPISRGVNLFEKSFSRLFDCIVCATPEIESKFKKYNRNAVTIRNFPRLGMFFKEQKEKKDGVCYVGGISEPRGLSKMLEATKKSNTPIYLAGQPLDNEFDEKISKNDLFNYVGFLNKEGVNEIFNQSIAGLVVLQDIEAYKKSLPVKMFEYMSAGLPVIYSNFPLWRELIGKYNCGIAVDPNNTDEISEAISFFVNNPEKATEMGENGIKAIAGELNWGIEGSNLVDIYKKII